MFDLTLFPLSIEAGQVHKDLPGFYIAPAPRKAQRLRAGDTFIAWLTQTGNAQLPAHTLQELLARLADGYFNAPGSVTAGLRATLERLNDFLLARNLRGSAQGAQLAMTATLGALHGETLYLGQAGGTHTLSVAPNGAVQRFHDSSQLGRGLGLARTTSIRYFTAVVEPGALLVFTAEPPAFWSDERLSAALQAGESTLPGLLGGDALNLAAGAVRVAAGKGMLRTVSAAPAVPAAPPPVALPAAPAAEAAPSGAHWVNRPQTESPSPARLETAPRAEAAPVQRRAGPPPAAVKTARAAVDGLASVRKGAAKLAEGFGRLLARVFPSLAGEAGLNLSAGTMLFIAVAVPLAVTALAVTIYLQRGRGEQHRIYLTTAQQYAAQALDQAEAAQALADWQQSLYWLDKAAPYGDSPEAAQLRVQAQTAVDNYDGITRLDYRPALEDALPAGVNITRIVTTLNDLYLLDSSQGRVLRLYRTGTGYALDLQFKCTPGRAGSIIIQPLVDIAGLPPNNEFRGATVMGIDPAGNLMYCIPNTDSFDSRTLTPPDVNWGAITRMVYSQNSLYVIDPQVNAVYRYAGDKGPSFGGAPRSYFDLNIPRLTDIADLAVDTEYLYLLHNDGTITQCTASGVNTECVEPAPYGDSRPGRSSEPTSFDGTRFLLMQATQPPNPSLYILDQSAASIYEFSLRKLNFQRQYRGLAQPDVPLPNRKPTAFAITTNRRAFLAFGNELFVATLP